MTKRGTLAVWGTSGHALVVADIVRLMGFEIAGFLDDFILPSRQGMIHGLPHLGGKDNVQALIEVGINKVVLAFGHCNARLNLSAIARDVGLDLVTAIHPKAVIASDVLVGDGSVIVAGAVINPGTQICENAIINTCASVDHECLIGDGAHIGPGAHLGGRVIVERAAWVGIGATIKDRVRIGANSIVGAGAVVLNDVPKDSVVFGVPARVVRPVKSSEN